MSIVTASNGAETVIVRDATLSNGDITSAAGKLPEGARVAVSGVVHSADDTDFVLERPDGQVRAEMRDDAGASGTGFNAELADEIQVGRSVTVYGQLRRIPGDVTQVEAEAVYDNKSGKFLVTPLGHAHFARQSGTQRVELHYQPL